MRDELNLMELADRYVRGELSAADRIAFEERMRTNTELRELVEDERALLGGLERAALRPSVDKAYRRYRLGKWLPWAGVAFVAALLWVGGMLLNSEEHVEPDTIPVEVPAVVPADPTDAVPAGDAGEGSIEIARPRTTTTVSHDTVLMIMRDGKMTRATPADTIGKGAYRQVITIPVEGSSEKEVQQQIDSIQRAGSRVTFDESAPVQVIPKDSLQKLFDGKLAPRLN